MEKSGTKFDSEKPRMDLISPAAMLGLAKILEFGAARYGDRNWENGLDFSRAYSALLRHLFSWWGGEDLDPDTQQSHTLHILCNSMFLAHYTSNYKKYEGFDNRPHKLQLELFKEEENE